MAKSAGKSSDCSGLALEIRKFHYYQKQLSRILSDTQKALKDVTHLNLFPLESSIVDAVKASQVSALRPPAIVVLGAARARLVNLLLGEELLPSHSNSTQPNGWRWLRLQHGNKKHLRLSFGNEFEIIEPNFPMNFNWSKITSQNLSRNDNLDLSTVMDIELCNPFLENGVQILIPPDLGDLALCNKPSYAYTQESTIKDYETFFSKRGSFLENVFPIILYALDDESLELEKTPYEPKKDENLTPSKNINIPMSSASFNILRNFKNHQNKSEPDNKIMNSMSKFYVDFDMKDSYESDHSLNIILDTQKDAIKKDSNNIDLQFQNLPGLSEENLLDLRQIYELHPNVQVLFILLSDHSEKITPQKSNYPTTNDNASKKENIPENSDENGFSETNSISEEVLLVEKQKSFLIKLVEQLELMSNPLMESSFTGHWLIVDDNNIDEQKINKSTKRDNTHFDIIMRRQDFILNLGSFIKGCLQKYMLNECKKLSEIHNMLLQQFILSSFDMAREMQIIPRKIQYVAEMEQQLYNALNATFSGDEKREELLAIMQRVLQEMKQNIEGMNLINYGVVCHASNECINLKRSKFYSDITNSTQSKTQNDVILSNADLDEYDIINNPLSSDEVTVIEAVEVTEGLLAHSQNKANIKKEKECTSSNCASHQGSSHIVEINSNNISISIDSNNSINSVSFKQASLEIQRTVLGLLSRNISIQLVKFFECLRDSYYGTLQRCLESLEEGRRKRAASEAVKQILLVTRTVDLQQYASFSFLHALVDQLRRFFQRISFSNSGNRSCCVQSARWRRQIALDTLESLNAPKLAKLISSQLRERIRLSHEQFQSALNLLGEHHTARLQQTEELKITVRKLHAPRFARLCLESTSLGDLARHGVPRLSKEIGRGQYGVVYSVKSSWGGFEPCAVKSVVPPDERHFNELAMEFFHTRNLPVHDRIVQLKGSVIDYSYEGGSPAVLLISERLRWDLHCALMNGKMSFVQRMQVAIDIVEGIRYLHSQGLVHRDIKLKNVLLDESNRAKLTDLGFCIPEAMMSGSIVGTPVHMAPELLSGFYDNSVDVYAFGILFWYVCAGHVRLPAVFEHFQNKEQLWSNVKRGLRPEKLPQFSETCWSLMERCWAAEPSQRPLLGDVQPILESTRDTS